MEKREREKRKGEERKGMAIIRTKILATALAATTSSHVNDSLSSKQTSVWIVLHMVHNACLAASDILDSVTCWASFNTQNVMPWETWLMLSLYS